ncbi:MAG: hypothetical protein H7Y88_02260 [Phycisphaerales bacterium]|nr:hypothetical protein [Phycisphaerales bacterium]
MNTHPHRDALEEYQRRRDTFVAAVRKLKTHLRTLFAEHGVTVHKVEARAKSLDSLQEKLSRAGKVYVDPLEELPDLVGLRVIVQSLDEIDVVARFLDAQFEIVTTEDKEAVLRADQFGYRSVHKVCRLRRGQGALTEWHAYADMRFEVQVRTLLQHVWANASHDLQYKRDAVPRETQRRLARLSSLLELADRELWELRTEAGMVEFPAVELVQPTVDEPRELPDELRGVRSAMSTPLSRKIIAAARRAGIEELPQDQVSMHRLDRLWSAMERWVGVEAEYLLRRIVDVADVQFAIVKRELEKTGVVRWRCTDSQVLAAATVLALGEPRLHKYLLRGWPRGYLDALRAAMHRS